MVREDGGLFSRRASGWTCAKNTNSVTRPTNVFFVETTDADPNLSK